MKNRMLSIRYLFALSALLVTACGSGTPEDDGKRPNPRNKLEKIDQDEASSAHAMMILAGYGYLNQAAREAIQGAGSSACRRIRMRQNFPTGDATAAQAQMLLKSECDQIEGIEEFAYANLRLLPANPQGINMQFENLKVSSAEPLKVRGSTKRNPELLLNHQLELKLKDATKHLYEFELASEWKTLVLNGIKPLNDRVAWQVRLTGVLEARARPISGVVIQDLVVSLQSLRQKLSPSQQETMTLNASPAAATVPTDLCGLPQTEWAAVYTTTLFPTEQLNANLRTEAGRLHNLTLLRQYDLPSCGPLAWVNNALSSMRLLLNLRK